MKDFKPTQEGTPFKITGKTDMNQDMVVEKLSLYLTITNQHLHIISQIQIGICDALVHFFIDKGGKIWGDAMQTIAGWNGKDAPNAPLTAIFESLLEYVQLYQLGRGNLKRQFLGENINLFLATMLEGSASIIGNPWHVIAVRRISESHYEVYDPNHVGIKTVSDTQLHEVVTYSLGALVTVDSNDSTLQPAITTPEQFIADGGLLTLCDTANIDPLLDILMASEIGLSKQALQGLLLRDNEAKPAWVIGIKNADPRIKALTIQWLNQFKTQYPDSSRQLQQSMRYMSPMQNHALANDIIQATSTTENKVLQEELLSLCWSFEKMKYQQQLSTWKRGGAGATTLKAFCQKTLHPLESGQTHLIECNSLAEVDALSHGLQQYCHGTNRPVFYIDKPDDLICSAPFLFENKETHTASLRKGPGGPLYNFLQAHQDDRPVLVVNYTAFQPDEIRALA